MRPANRKPADAVEGLQIKRAPDWSIKLQEVIDWGRSQEFDYGTFDCASFAGKIIEAMTGDDHLKTIRGYKGKVAALRKISDGGGLEAMITAKLGAPIHPAMAQRGDILLATMETDTGQSDAIGVCLGSQAAFAGSGVVFKPTLSARLAWRVP